MRLTADVLDQIELVVNALEHVFDVDDDEGWESVEEIETILNDALISLNFAIIGVAAMKGA